MSLLKKLMSNEGVKRNQALASPELRNTVPVPISQILEKIHPQIINTPIAQTTVDIICGLKPLLLFENDPNAKSHALGEIDDRIVRGSLIKRWELGTPEGYKEIKDVFQCMGQSNSNSKITNKVISKLSEGPIEIDLRFGWADGMKDSIAPNIISTLLSTGYSLNTTNEDTYFTKDGITVSLSSLKIGSNLYPRTLHNVTFTKDNEKIFILDIADLPNERKFRDEMRLAGESGLFEMFATERLDIRDHDVFVMQDADLKYIWKDKARKGRQMYSFGHILREVGNMVFWPKKFKSKDTYEMIPLLNYFKNTGSFYSRNGLNNKKDRQLFEKRKESYASDSILYMTYDPFLFLFLGKQADLFTSFPLLKKLNSGVEWDDFLLYFCRTVAHEIGFEEPISLESIPRLSKHYKKSVLMNPEREVNQIGPLLLIKAINSFEGPNGKSKQLPVTLDSFISLLTPNK